MNKTNRIQGQSPDLELIGLKELFVHVVDKKLQSRLILFDKDLFAGFNKKLQHRYLVAPFTGAQRRYRSSQSWRKTL